MHKSYKAVRLQQLACSMCAIACWLVAASSAIPGVAAAESAPISTASVYTVQAGDVLLISVWKEPELQGELLVRPDGGMSFPLVGDLQAEGQSIAQLQLSITERLRKYIPDPVVTVSVKLIGGSRIYVLGKVNRPGEYPLYRPLDVMQALSLAGGTTPFASVNDIEVLRRESGKQVAIRFRYGDVERGKALEQNMLLKSGDTVVVP